MDSGQVNDVIDKLAEKLGVAADKMQPVVGQVVREYQAMQIATAIGCAVIALLCGAGLVCLWRWAKTQKEWFGADTEPKPRLIGLLAGNVVLAAGVISGAINGLLAVRCACAPTYFLLKNLLAQ